MILADAIQAFRAAHNGKAPAEVVITTPAGLIMAMQEEAPGPQWDGVPVRLALPNEVISPVLLGKGTFIYLSVWTDGLQRPCVVAHEAVNRSGGMSKQA